MLKRLATLAALVFFLGPTVTFADDDLSYNDPAIHYTAPDGWTKIDVPQSEDAPVAAYTKTFSRYDTRVITLKLEKNVASLDGFETAHESEQRSQNQDVFVDKKQRITMPNGMPAWQMRYSFGSEAGNTVRILEYVVFDGRRGITLSYAGRAGTFDDKDALAALSTLSVVLYPEGH